MRQKLPVDAINPAHGSVLRVNSPSLGIFSLHSPYISHIPPLSPRLPRLSHSVRPAGGRAAQRRGEWRSPQGDDTIRDAKRRGRRWTRAATEGHRPSWPEAVAVRRRKKDTRGRPTPVTRIVALMSSSFLLSSPPRSGASGRSLSVHYAHLIRPAFGDEWNE